MSLVEIGLFVLYVGYFSCLGAVSYTVTSNADSGIGTLRDAIETINKSADETNLITFDFSQKSTTITLLSALPVIMRPVIIDGYAHGMGELNTLSIGNNAQLKITLKDQNDVDSINSGLVIAASQCTIKGLVLGGF